MYEDNGVVPTDDEEDGPAEQGAASSTIDPMQAVKTALAYGRKQMGLPSNFSTGAGDEASFDEGGEVPEQGMIPEQPQQDQPADVTGGGNALPDPKKTLAYLTGAGGVSPEIASAFERHIDPQGAMDPSQRVMKAISSAPNPEAAFGLMQHYRAKFNAYSGAANAALDTGNLGQAAIHATKAFANVPGAAARFAPTRGGIAVMPAKTAQPQAQGFDGGGEVEVDDEEPQYTRQDPITVNENDGVLPTPDEIEKPAMAPAPAEQEASTPTVLTPEQFKKLMTAGYDKPLDEGWGGLISSITGALGPSTADAATLPQPGQQHPADAGGTTVVPKTKGDRLAPKPNVSPALQKQMDTPTPLQQVTDAEQDREQDAGDPKQLTIYHGGVGERFPKSEEANARDDRYSEQLRRVQNLARQLYPMASQGDAASKYVAHAMQQFMDNNESKREVGAQTEEGRVNAAETRGYSRATQQATHDAAVSERAKAAQDNKAAMAKTATDQRARAVEVNFARSIITNLRNNKPSVTPEEINAELIRRGVNPQVLQQGGSAAPQGADVTEAKVGDIRPYVRNGVTKNYKFGGDGMWHLAQ